MRSELKKVFSRHSTISLIVGLALISPLLSAAFVVLSSGFVGVGPTLANPALQQPEELLLLVFRGSDLFCALLGTLLLTAEYGSSAIYRTYQSFRNRLVALAGKFIILVGATFIAGLIASALSILILNISGLEVFSIDSPLLLVCSVVADCLLVASFSFGIALILSKTVPALIATLGIIYILPSVVKTILDFFAPDLAFISLHLPANAASAGIAKTLQGSSYTGIDPVQGLISATAMALLVLVAGYLIQRQKDV
jgi:hypothetical protein